MSARSSSAKRRLVLGAVLLAGLGLGGCADYLKRRDTVTLAAGDAQAHNAVVHIADPWPPSAANTRIGGHGGRVDRVVQRYLAGTADAAAPAPAASAPPPASNSAAPAASP